MVFKPNEKDFRPKVSIQSVLGFDNGQVIDSRDDAAIEDNEVIFAWGKDHALLASRGKEEQQDNRYNTAES
jgi:hypothetical protein